MTLGERIKEERKKHKLTQIDLANKLGITKGTVSTWETNSRRPSFETLEELCSMFHVNLDYLMGRSDDSTVVVPTDEEMADLVISEELEDMRAYTQKYCRLDEFGKKAVEALILAEYSRCKAQGTLNNQTVYSVNIGANK